MQNADAEAVLAQVFRHVGDAFGLMATKDLLLGVIPGPIAWTFVDPAEGAKCAEIYVLAGRAVYRIRASVERTGSDASECECALLPITDRATFSVHTERRPGLARREPLTTRDWRFWFGEGDRMDLELHTETLGGREDAGDPNGFAVALANRIARD
jgi:hypothetical protein